MPHSIHTKRLSLTPARLLAGAAPLTVALAVAGCGGTSGPAVAHLSSGKGASSASSEATGLAAENTTSPEQAGLVFAKCMRSNGAPNFPDPKAGGGFLFHAGAGTISSPTFKVAQAKCHKLMPGGGPPGPGSTTNPSPRTLARFLRIARCMRQHAVYNFPDPRTSVPSEPFGSGYGVISDIEGVIFVFPSTIDQQSPAFARAAAACAFPLHNH